MEPAVCKYFLQGNCKFGDRCRYSHQAPSGMNDGGNRPFGGTNAFDKPSNPFGRDFPSGGKPSFGAPSAFGAAANTGSAFGAASFGGGMASGGTGGGGGFGSSMFGPSSNAIGGPAGAPTGFMAPSTQPAFG
eukprot:CAMPEP_0184701244 /NCGR_PEP_ID=MMETSP0313-20130426/18822_1 /TAXON_ID=2792 /ORGANISM="Porphyridium aerugineum, Strain SAG 1380-2" /LENGTH=131 /DNA_ID=CAMNT_0027161233 /DNA_START=21 /DNA_END=413 /DNA_ORIENTATION=-